MRLPTQPRREVVWTIEWPPRFTNTGLSLHGQRQAWAIIIEERYRTHGEFLISGKSYKVYALSSPMECPNTPKYFPTLAQARKWATTLLGIYGGFITRPEWTPGTFMNSRWTDPMWRERWHRSMLTCSPEASKSSTPLLLTA